MYSLRARICDYSCVFPGVGGHLCVPSAQQQERSAALLPSPPSISVLSRVNHMRRAPLCPGLCSSLLSPDETQAHFIFLSLIARPLTSALHQRYVMCCTVAAGCSGAPSHAVVLALRVGSQPLSPFPPSVFSDAVV